MSVSVSSCDEGASTSAIAADSVGNTSTSTSVTSKASGSADCEASVSQTKTSDDGLENLEDYETQLFGFTPKSFVSGIYNAVSEYFMEALKTLEDYISEQYGQLMTRSEVVEKMTLIRRHLVTQIDKAFDTLETYLTTNIFCIPSNVVLPEDEVQMDESVIQEEEEKVLKETELVKKKILAVKLVNAMLKKRLQQTIELQKTLDKILEHLDQADGVVRKEGVVDLRDSLKHCADRILGTIRIWKDLEAGDSDSAQEGVSVTAQTDSSS